MRPRFCELAAISTAVVFAKVTIAPSATVAALVAKYCAAQPDGVLAARVTLRFDGEALATNDTLASCEVDEVGAAERGARALLVLAAYIRDVVGISPKCRPARTRTFNRNVNASAGRRETFQHQLHFAHLGQHQRQHGVQRLHSRPLFPV